jgi:spore germination cell wall hydrolase CwlJ-like protein
VFFGGIMLVLAFAFAGHYMGENASAHNAIADDTLDGVVAPASTIVSKGSLLPDGVNFDIVNANLVARQTVAELRSQTVMSEDKTDYVLDEPKSDIQVIPVSVDLTAKPAESSAPRLLLTPPRNKIEQSFRLKRAEKNPAQTQRRLQLAEENCLARAVYFEARSETELGQLAVAKVILNRVKDPNYPNTICGVVYQGSSSRNSCQFSFACDGLPDDVRQPAAWANAKRIAQKAIAGDASVGAIGTATNYHADYVNPSWARSMKRLIKIGHHIFYSDT